ncbi:MAG TPA: type II toxin-antitoxin system VapC family toxin [Terriglobales bacterium]|jgi:PIN domain nuclease of toxin-antitoxin system
MNYLLDTNVFLWAESHAARLNSQAREILSDGHQAVYLSPASSWEISIKVELGKLRLPEPPRRFVLRRMARGRWRSLPITHEHALQAGALPLHHRDPFDRMLIAQARSEGMVVMTADRQLEKYPVEILWCAT